MHCIVLCSPQLCNIVFFLAKSCGIWTTCSGAQVVRCRRWKLNVGHLAGYCFFSPPTSCPFSQETNILWWNALAAQMGPPGIYYKNTTSEFLKQSTDTFKDIQNYWRSSFLSFDSCHFRCHMGPWVPLTHHIWLDIQPSGSHLEICENPPGTARSAGTPPLKLKWLGSPIQFAGYLSGCFSGLGQKQVFWYCSGSK